MKYGICLWSLPLDVEKAIEKASKLGFEGAVLLFSEEELTGGMAKKAEEDKLKKAAEKYGIEFLSVGVNVLNQYGMSQKKDREKVREILIKAVKFAHEMGVKVLQLPSFVNGKIKTEEDIEEVIENLRFVCDEASNYGILVGHESVLTVTEIKRIQREVNKENLLVFYDGANYANSNNGMEIEVYEELKDQIKKLNQLHIKDRCEDKITPVIIGNGVCNQKEVLKAIKKSGFDGYLILESNYDKFPEYEKWINKDLENLKNIF